MIVLEKVYLANVLLYFTSSADVVTFSCISKKCQDVLGFIRITPSFIHNSDELATAAKNFFMQFKLFPNLETVVCNRYYFTGFIKEQVVSVVMKNMNLYDMPKELQTRVTSSTFSISCSTVDFSQFPELKRICLDIYSLPHFADYFTEKDRHFDFLRIKVHNNNIDSDTIKEIAYLNVEKIVFDITDCPDVSKFLSKQNLPQNVFIFSENYNNRLVGNVLVKNTPLTVISGVLSPQMLSDYFCASLSFRNRVDESWDFRDMTQLEDLSFTEQPTTIFPSTLTSLHADYFDDSMKLPCLQSLSVKQVTGYLPMTLTKLCVSDKNCVFPEGSMFSFLQNLGSFEVSFRPSQSQTLDDMLTSLTSLSLFPSNSQNNLNEFFKKVSNLKKLECSFENLPLSLPSLECLKIVTLNSIYQEPISLSLFSNLTELNINATGNCPKIDFPESVTFLSICQRSAADLSQLKNLKILVVYCYSCTVFLPPHIEMLVLNSAMITCTSECTVDYLFNSAYFPPFNQPSVKVFHTSTLFC
ncbi:hypothetical protein EIN_065600 [Entamoeba invadens IP1]|uniref:Uncharacterized protein n=1 Tax=Entamoeba invadens IP1 TaxID=370355 RepID=A0A0A1TXM8_ENTIV|nr:hypothetical protein EIN_065600 [Entamoeba invadens IP1]ELP84285.1 hypothetical protein EIN_065600 [Entamoeba invadens IP1]|eukprot:XP_004183631.1 hypothetical protein EIN_065600 [Entamoeba invadens IP1]